MSAPQVKQLASTWTVVMQVTGTDEVVAVGS
jgi:hypothetical protein